MVKPGSLLDKYRDRAIMTARQISYIALAVVIGSSVAGRAYVLNSSWPSSMVQYYVNPDNLDVPSSEAIGRGPGCGRHLAPPVERGVPVGVRGDDDRDVGGVQRAERGLPPERIERRRHCETYRWRDGTRILEADIVYWDGAFTFYTGESGCSSGHYLEDIGADEFGHALGLDHTSVSGATMVGSTGGCNLSLRTLAADDIAGVEALYPPGGTTSTPPTAPSNLSARQNSANPSSAIDVSWADPSYEEQVLVERSANGGAWVQAATLPANSTAYRDTGLAAGSTYAYRSRAINSAGFSGYSNTSSATTAAPSAPGTPGKLPAKPAA